MSTAQSSSSAGDGGLPIAAAVQEVRKQACLGCRGIKVACRLPAGAPLGSTCTRCIRLSFDCVYGSTKSRGAGGQARDRARQSTSMSTGAGSDHSHRTPPLDSSSASIPGSTLHQGVVSPHQVTHQEKHHLELPLYPPPLPPPPPSVSFAGNVAAASPASSSTQFTSSIASFGDGGNSQLRDNSILALMEEAEARSVLPHSAPPPRPSTRHSYPDPVDLHVLGMLEAVQLFDFFHTRLNPFIILFDRKLHTAERVRETSTTLFTAILAVSAKFFRPHLYSALLQNAQQLCTRGIADALSQIGLVQSLCLLVYWKEVEDGSAWLKIGIAIRLAYQLRLHNRRKGPLPADELEARMVLDRERTWFCLICFDFAYKLHDDTDSNIRSLNSGGLQIDHWLEETILFECADDLQLAASIEICSNDALIDAIERSDSPATRSALAVHVGSTLANISAKYFEPLSPPHRLSGSQSLNKLKFVYLASHVSLSRAILVGAGVQDPVALADHLGRAADLTASAIQLAESGMLTYVQDVVALILFKFAEWLTKLFPLVEDANQRTIVLWMTQIYSACTAAKGDQEAGVPAILSRFFRLAIRALSIGNSLPPTRQGSPRNGVRCKSGSGDAAGGGSYENPFDQLGPQLEQELFPDLPQVADGLHWMNDDVDAKYWESLFPGHSDESWAWLAPQPAGSTDAPLSLNADLGMETL